MRQQTDWRYVVLGAIRDGQVYRLSQIYEIVETGLRELIPNLINPRLLEFNPRINRPRYQKNIQATCCKLFNEGLAERVDRGYYRITEKGRERLPD